MTSAFGVEHEVAKAGPKGMLVPMKSAAKKFGQAVNNVHPKKPPVKFGSRSA